MNLSNTLLASTLAKQNPRSRSVSKNVATDRLAAIGASKEGARSRVALNLVGQEYGNVELYAMSEEIEAN